MSKELTVSEKIDSHLAKTKTKFNELNASVNPLNFKAEADFARQALIKNPYLMDVARNNLESLQDSISNVAAIGISLNPADKHAYLVPRTVNKKPTVCLDISYMGMIKLATDTGVVEYLKAEIIHENDNFVYKGFDSRPEISVSNPFDRESRGAVIGVIAWGKLKSGSYINEFMNIDELHQIRDDSEAYKGAVKKGGWALDNCVWVKYYGEMIKKTVIKRLYKTLPQSDGSQVMANAINVLNQHEGIEFNSEPATVAYTDEESDAYRIALDNADYTGLLSLIETLDEYSQPQLIDLHETPRMPKGGKGKYTKMMEENMKVARELRDDNLAAIIEMCEQQDSEGLAELWNECNQYEKDWYMRKLNNEQRAQVAA